MRRESRRHNAEIPNGHTAETPSTLELAGFYVRTPSGLRAFRELPSGIRALRVYTVVGMCCVEGLTASIASEVVVGPPR